MRTRKGSHASDPGQRIPAVGHAGRNANSVAPTPPAATGSTLEDKPERRNAGGGGWLRDWWRRYRAEFTSSHPETQVAQIYHVTSIVVLVGTVIAAIWAFGEHFWPDSTAPVPTSATTTPGAPAAREAASAPLSIVVLPFVNLSGDAAQEYFADGITHSLTTDLSRALPGSFVVARETAFTYKGRPIDARQVGRDLHVRYALEGSTLLEGQQVRVNAQLVDAQAGNELWAERFDIPRSDILRVQDEIVGRISRAVGLQVINFEARRSEHEKPGNAQAIDLVLRGRP